MDTSMLQFTICYQDKCDLYFKEGWYEYGNRLIAAAEGLEFRHIRYG
jgi:hypothetical protein